MRPVRVFYFVAFLAVLSIMLPACSQGTWMEYSSPAYAFTAQFPGSPDIKTDTQELGNGIQSVTTDHSVNPKYGVIGPKFTVIVTEIKVPADTPINFDEEAALQGAKEGIKKEGGDIVSEQQVSLGDLQGWEFEVTSSKGDSTLRYFHKGFTIYVLEVARKKGKKYPEEVAKFFDSFTLQ